MKLVNISKVLLCAAILGGTQMACNKKLDVSPRQSVDATVAIQTSSDLEAAVVGMYSLMGGGSLYGTDLLMNPEIQASFFPNTEQYCSWRGTFTGPQQVARKTMNRDNGVAAAFWTAGYRAINSANLVLENLAVADADVKDQYEGEARFVRAAMHFELVRFFALPWGATTNNDHLGVVIKTTGANNEAEAAEKLPRNTVAQVYAAVIADLTAAAAKLPDDNGTRVDKYAALAFLSKVYLQKGDYAAARDAANQVIQSGKYSMNASVRAVFDNKNTAESIWEIQQNEQNNAGTANNGMATFFASLPGIGRADVRIAPAFANTYPAGDLRRVEWYYIGTGARPGNLYCSKWKSFSQNLPVIRIAEIYLIRAETNLRLGTTVGDTPENDLAEIRNPVRTNLAVIANPTLANVLAERRLELAFEGFRIHEIKRLQQSFSVWTWTSPELVYPIPQQEVDATSGALIQNPGY